jgi:hypothetical protein
LCWESNHFNRFFPEYVTKLDAADITAIDEAIIHFKSEWLMRPKSRGSTSLMNPEQNIELAQISSSTFPLPAGLSERLRSLSKGVHEGRGFAALRGFEPGHYSDEGDVIAFCGIASYVGVERSCNRMGMAMSTYYECSC